MNRLVPGFGPGCLCLPILTVLMALPTSAPAAWFGVRNSSTVPVIFQGSSVVNNVVRRGRPQMLLPGQESREFVMPGPKIISVYDGRLPGRVLYEKPHLCGNQDQYFLIQVGVVVVPPGVQVPQAALIPVLGFPPQIK